MAAAFPYVILFCLSCRQYFCLKNETGFQELYAEHSDICALCPRVILCDVLAFWQWIKQFLNLVAQGKMTFPRNKPDKK